jgi:hypothetical protein
VVQGGGRVADADAHAPHGVKTEYVLNCSVEEQPVDVWIQDLTLGGDFADLGTLGSQYDAAHCPASGSVPLTFSPQSGHYYRLVATERTLATCDGTNDPHNGGCQKMDVSFVGDANGYRRIDTVDLPTQILP